MENEVTRLISVIDAIDQIGNEHWIAGLNDRKLKELQFHDRDRDEAFALQSKASDTYERFYGNKKYYRATRRSSEYVEDWIKRECALGGVFLDYACGNGANARLAAKAGASLALGFDISSVSVKNAREIAARESVKNIRYFQADAEDTRLPAGSIDRVICSGMLHHLDLSYALPELRRVLKPGGKVLAIEALDYNPLIKLYRLLTPDMRTEWEKAHILSLKDVEFARRFFNVESIKFWHVVGYISGKLPIMQRPLESLDAILERVPFIQRMAWIFTFELGKD